MRLTITYQKRLLRETRVHRAAEVGVCKLMPLFACLWIREFVTKTITKGGGDKQHTLWFFEIVHDRLMQVVAIYARGMGNCLYEGGEKSMWTMTYLITAN